MPKYSEPDQRSARPDCCAESAARRWLNVLTADALDGDSDLAKLVASAAEHLLVVA